MRRRKRIETVKKRSAKSGRVEVKGGSNIRKKVRSDADPGSACPVLRVLKLAIDS